MNILQVEGVIGVWLGVGVGVGVGVNLPQEGQLGCRGVDLVLRVDLGLGLGDKS
jgi:hypothetical protein